MSFGSTNDPKLDTETTLLEDGTHTLDGIQRHCQRYATGAVYGNDSGLLGAVTRKGRIVLGAANARDVAMC